MRLLPAGAAVALLALAGVAASGPLVLKAHPAADASVDLHAWCEAALRACWDLDPASLGMTPVDSALPPTDGTLAGGAWETGHKLGVKLLGQKAGAKVGASASANVSNGADQGKPAQVPCDDAPHCPDLVGDPSEPAVTLALDERTFTATSCAVQEGATQAGTRRLLRFGYNAANVGVGDLRLGDPSLSPQWFQWGSCHGHWHFADFAAYRLWDVEGYAAWLAVKAGHPGVASDELLAAYPELAGRFLAGHKQGFCLRDSVPWMSPPAGLVFPRQFTDCATDQGITPFWADQYHRHLDGQWVDVTGLAPGAYVLETEVNPDRIYLESDYANNSAALVVRL